MLKGYNDLNTNSPNTFATDGKLFYLEMVEKQYMMVQDLWMKLRKDIIKQNEQLKVKLVKK
jgi:hypothetical protein